MYISYLIISIGSISYVYTFFSLRIQSYIMSDNAMIYFDSGYGDSLNGCEHGSSKLTVKISCQKKKSAVFSLHQQ